MEREYTCPMDPEVRQKGPGACPKCGMALEPVDVAPVTKVEWTCPTHPEIVRDAPGSCPICAATTFSSVSVIGNALRLRRVSLGKGASSAAGSGIDATPRYTPIVSWKRKITILVLTVLTALPVSGTVCAMVCESAGKTAASHHGSGKNCEEAARPSAEVQIGGVSEHDCSTHDAAMRELATTAAERGHLTTASTALALAVVHSTTKILTDPQSVFDYSAPPGTAPPTATPQVLRA